MKRQGGRDRQRECEWKSEGNIFFGREGGKLVVSDCTAQEYSSSRESPVSLLSIDIPESCTRRIRERESLLFIFLPVCGTGTK